MIFTDRSRFFIPIIGYFPPFCAEKHKKDFEEQGFVTTLCDKWRQWSEFHFTKQFVILPQRESRITILN